MSYTVRSLVAFSQRYPVCCGRLRFSGGEGFIVCNSMGELVTTVLECLLHMRLQYVTLRQITNGFPYCLTADKTSCTVLLSRPASHRVVPRHTGGHQRGCLCSHGGTIHTGQSLWKICAYTRGFSKLSEHALSWV